MAEPYAQYVYAKPVTEPVVVALQPTDETYAELSDVDFLIVTAGDVETTAEYERIMDHVTGIHHVASWSDVDSAVAAALAGIGDAPVAQVLAGHADAAPVADALRVKLGVRPPCASPTP